MKCKLSHLTSICAFLLAANTFASSLPSEAPFYEQPLSHQIEGFNWSSSFWGGIQGGLDRRRQNCKDSPDCFSPAEKLDLITQNRFGFKKQNEALLKDTPFRQRFWLGYCDGIAVLQLTFPHINLQNINYENEDAKFVLYPADLIAMAALAIAKEKAVQTKYTPIAERCFQPRLFFDHKKPGCNDLTPMDLHRVLIDHTAQNKPIGVDFSQYHWVNNHVIQGYQLKTESIDAHHVKVEATVNFYKVGYKPMDDIYQPTSASKTYEYELTLDDAGKITGSRWLNRKQPDFFWHQTVTAFTEEFSFLNRYFFSVE